MRAKVCILWRNMICWGKTTERGREKRMKEEIYGRALRWDELFAMTIYYFTQNIREIFMVMLVIFLPISLLEGAILDGMTSLTQAMQQLLPQTDAAVPNTVDAAEVMRLLQQVLVHEGLLFAVTLFLQPVGTIAVAKLIKQQIDGAEISVKWAILEALNLEPTILVSGLLYGILVSLGSLIVIPGIYFSVAWGLYLFCIGLGERKGWDALRHSKELVKGKWWRTLGYLYLMMAVNVVTNMALQVILLLDAGSVVLQMVYHFLCYFPVAFVAIGEGLLFLNREAMTGGLRGLGASIPADAAEKTEEKDENS